MKIYICSHNPKMAKAYAEGREITYDWWNRWLPDASDDQYAATARLELGAIRAADEVHVLTEEGLRVPGGMWFEAGFAFALGKRVILVGPKVNIFCRLLESTCGFARGADSSNAIGVERKAQSSVSVNGGEEKI